MDATSHGVADINNKTSANVSKQNSVKRKRTSSFSILSCFLPSKTFKQIQIDDLIKRVERNSNRNCFTLPPPGNSDEYDADTKLSTPTNNPNTLPRSTGTRKQFKFPIFKIKTDATHSFLKAAKSGNIKEISKHLQTDAAINVTNSNGLNALHLAAKGGHAPVLRELLDHNVSIDEKTKKGNTALHIASLAGNLEIVKLLVERGAEVNAKAENGFTPLYMASQENHLEIITYLLSKGADQTISTDDGFTPLAVAMQQGHDKIVTVLLEHDSGSASRLPALHIAAKKDDVHAANLLLANPDVNVNHPSASGFTPLHIAAHYGKLRIAKLLINFHADVNYNAKNNITPLHVASKWNKCEIVRLLINKGAKLESRTRDGLTPMHCAALAGNTKVVQLLLSGKANHNLKTRNGLSPLHMAAQGNHEAIAKLLLKKKALPDDITLDYLTPLHIAAHCGNIEVAKVLLENKCDVNARAFNGFTPLQVACKKKRIEMVELLLKNGAAIEATTQTGLTALHVAAVVGFTEGALVLLKANANVNQTSLRNETPLHLAVRSHHVEIVKLLLEYSASLKTQAQEGHTALHIATRTGDFEAVRLLVEAGADVNADARGKYRLLHLATKEGHSEIFKYLLEHGADPDAKSKHGYSIIHIAAKYGRLKILQILSEQGIKLNLNAPARSGLTPFHVAVYYGYPEVVNYFIENGADIHLAGRNGLTPLHRACKLKSPEIAVCLLKAGSMVDCISQNGYTPLHIASQEGNIEIVKYLVDQSNAQISIKANDGLTALHLATQKNRSHVIEFLLSHGADPLEKSASAYTPLHETAYNGYFATAQFLLKHLKEQGNESILTALSNRTQMGCTPLHLAAQQGHSPLVELFLNSGADPNTRNMQGWTPAQIARQQCHLNVYETLAKVTDPGLLGDSPCLQGAGLDGISDGDSTLVDGSLVLDSPSEMIDTIELDSEDESDQLLTTPAVLRRSTKGQMMTSDDGESLACSSSYPQLFDEMEYTRPQQGKERTRISARDNEVPDHVKDSTKLNVEMGLTTRMSSGQISNNNSTDWNFESENVQISTKPVKAGFLVSFLIDARGGYVEAQRRPDLRFLIPPNALLSPTRIICRLLRPDRVPQLPALNDGDAFACRIIEMAPFHMRFESPILIEVPHYASIQGRDREVVILRCDNGETWKPHHLEATDQAVHDALGLAFDKLESTSILNKRHIQRILTFDIPKFFALISRFHQETTFIGPEGGVLSSKTVPQVQAVFPKGAVQKKIKVGLQSQVVSQQLINRMAGKRLAVSPVVTIEPRRRKFHKPITITIPLPTKSSNKSEAGSSELHLFCSITGGASTAIWEDITGTTQLTKHNDCLSFTTTVSARLWLVDYAGSGDVTDLINRVYQESLVVPYLAQFAIYARLPKDRKALIEIDDPSVNITSVDNAEIRCVCLIDDALEKTFEIQQRFQLIAVSPLVEVLDTKTYWIETVGDITSCQSHTGQLKLDVHAFQENRLTYPVRVNQDSNTSLIPVGKLSILREPRSFSVAGESSSLRAPIATLQIRLPDEQNIGVFHHWLETEIIDGKKTEWEASEVAELVQGDWKRLAELLGMSLEDIQMLESEPLKRNLSGVEADKERCAHMLSLWKQRSTAEQVPSDKSMGSCLTNALESMKITKQSVAVNLETEQRPEVALQPIEYISGELSKLPGDSAKEELPPTVYDGRPRSIAIENLPVIQIKSDDKKVPKQIEVAPSDKDNLTEDFIVPSTQNDILLLEQGRALADKSTIAMAVEQLCKDLELDVVEKTTPEDAQLPKPPVSEEVIHENVVLCQPIVLDSMKTEPPIITDPLQSIYIKTDLDNQLQIQIDDKREQDVSFEDLYEKSIQDLPVEDMKDIQSFPPSPTGLASHNVIQGRPEEGIMIEEYENTLPDGTLVKQRIQILETTQKVSSHDLEEAFQHAEENTENNYFIEPTEETVHVEENDEILPDGSIVKKIITTRHITERVTERESSDDVSEGQIIDDSSKKLDQLNLTHCGR